MPHINHYLKSIFTSAKTILNYKPWNYLYEHNIFGVKIPGTDRIYFISVMGSQGEVYAVTAYKGTEGLGKFFQLHESGGHDGPEQVLLTPQIMLSFESKKQMNKTEKAAAQAAELTFPGGKWPNLRETTPGWMPDFPGEDSLMDAAIVFEQACNVIQRAKDDTEIFYPPEKEKESEFLIREQNHKNDKQWIDVYEPVYREAKNLEITVNKNDIKTIKTLPQGNDSFAIDLRLIPAPTKSDNQTVFYPFMLLFVNIDKQIIESFHTFEPSPDYQTMLKRLPDYLTSFLAQQAAKPKSIDTRHEPVGLLMKKALEGTGIKINTKNDVPEINQVLDFFIEQLKETK